MAPPLLIYYQKQDIKGIFLSQTRHDPDIHLAKSGENILLPPSVEIEGSQTQCC